MRVETLVVVLGMVISLLLLAVFTFSLQLKAKRRTDELLRIVLTDEQYSQLMRQRYIDVPSCSNPKRIYRVPKLPGPVQVREKGSVTMWLCLQPLVCLPDEDIVVIHKLMIEADEEAYLRKANQLSPFYLDYYNGTTLMQVNR